MAGLFLQGPPPPLCLPVRAWAPSTGGPTTSLRVFCGLFMCVRWSRCCCCCCAITELAEQNPAVGVLSPHFVLPRPSFTSFSPTFPADTGICASPLRLFLVVCPHDLLCLDTLTTRSCEVATFQHAASLSELQLFLTLAVSLQVGHSCRYCTKSLCRDLLFWSVPDLSEVAGPCRWRLSGSRALQA